MNNWFPINTVAAQPTQKEVEPSEPAIVFSSQISLGSLLSIVLSVGAIVAGIWRIADRINGLRNELREEIKKVDGKLDNKIHEIEKELLKTHNKYERSFEAAEASVEIVEKDIALVRSESLRTTIETQRIMRDLDIRVQNLEQCALSSGFKFRQPKANLDIEGL